MNKYVQFVFVLFYCFMAALNIFLYFTLLNHWFFIAMGIVSVLTAFMFGYIPTHEERKIYKTN